MRLRLRLRSADGVSIGRLSRRNVLGYRAAQRQRVRERRDVQRGNVLSLGVLVLSPLIHSVERDLAPEFGKFLLEPLRPLAP